MLVSAVQQSELGICKHVQYIPSLSPQSTKKFRATLILNLRARIRDISEDQIEVVIEAVRDAVPGAIFAFACANDFKDFGLVLTGEYSCGHDVLHFSNDEEYSLNAWTLMPQHIQVGPGFPCEFIVKHTAPLRDCRVFIMTSQRPPEYDMIPIV